MSPRPGLLVLAGQPLSTTDIAVHDPRLPKNSFGRCPLIAVGTEYSVS